MKDRVAVIVFLAIVVATVLWARYFNSRARKDPEGMRIRGLKWLRFFQKLWPLAIAIIIFRLFQIWTEFRKP